MLNTHSAEGIQENNPCVWCRNGPSVNSLPNPHQRLTLGKTRFRAFGAVGQRRMLIPSRSQVQALQGPQISKLKTMRKLRVATFFSGYDSQCMALDRLGIDYELVAWSEIDKYAIQAHNAVYPQWADRNFGDITKINPEELPDFDLMTYSSPCQDFSNAGKQAGGEKGSGTRSSLLWCCEEIIRVKRPKFLLMENVKALVSKKFLPLFLKWDETLLSMGYTNYTKVLNSKDYGIPQNRERVFCVSILGGGWYDFPHPEPLQIRLKDILEEKVDEKYYISDKMLDYFKRVTEDTSHHHNFTPKDGDDIAFTLRTAGGQRVDDNFIKSEITNG